MQNWSWSVFPAIFALLWLLVGVLIGAMSGWFTLMSVYPDRKERAKFTLRFVSGRMAMANFGGILTLSVCASGLRLSVWRIFGVFNRNIFVPWSDLHVSRSRFWGWRRAELRFGQPEIGSLKISAYIADRLAFHAEGLWPEPGPIRAETALQIVVRVVIDWLIISTILSFFVFVAGYLTRASTDRIPVEIVFVLPVLIGFRSVVRLIVTLIQQ